VGKLGFICYRTNAVNAIYALNDPRSVGLCHDVNLAFPSEPRPVDALRGKGLPLFGGGKRGDLYL
jgi:hypothetical protein